MIGTEFVKMCREDIETHKDREVLTMLLQAVETLINENPGCEVDPNKTKFISEHLGMTERKFVNLEDFI